MYMRIDESIQGMMKTGGIMIMKMDAVMRVDMRDPKHSKMKSIIVYVQQSTLR